MSFFDDVSSANQGGLRPGDLFLRNRAGMSKSSSSATQSPTPTTGLAAGIAAYKKGLAAEQSINRTAPQAGVLPQTSVPPKTNPIAAPVPPSRKATTAAPGGLKTGDVKKGDQGDGLSATVNRIKKRQADQAANTPGHPLSVHPLSQDATQTPARQPAVTAALPTPRAQKPRSNNPRPTVPDAQTAEAVDGLLTEVTRWAQDLSGIDPQTRHDRLAKIWGWPYRGTYQPGSWGKDSVPELGTHAILDGIATRWPDMVPPHLWEDPTHDASRRVLADMDEGDIQPMTANASGGKMRAMALRQTQAQGDVDNPLDRAGSGPKVDPDTLLDGVAPEDLSDGDPNARAGDVQVADSGDYINSNNMGDLPWDDYGVPEEERPPYREGTVFYGGAGLDGEYIDDMVKALAEQGVLNVSAIDPEGRTDGEFGDAWDSAFGIRDRDDVPPSDEPFRNSPRQHNLVGYSYGSLLAAQDALDHADSGGRIDNVVLIGSPISQEMLDQLNEHPNIATVVVVDLNEQGDPIFAGMDQSDLVLNAPGLGSDLSSGGDAGKGHFYYGGVGKEAEERRRELARRLYELGLR